MDNQKQMIEEILEKVGIRYGMDVGGISYIVNAYKLSPYLQPKIPENAVVLTREEYEQLGLFVETVQEYASVDGQPVLVKERKTVKKLPTDIVEFVRKGIVDKFSERIEDLLKQPYEGKTEKQRLQRKGMEEGLKMALEIVQETKEKGI